MKKILAIVSMAAMVAGAAFAADASAKVNIIGSLLNYDAGSKRTSALSIAEGGQGWNPLIAFNFSGEKAGTAIKFYDAGQDGAANKNVITTDFSMWFKPIDMLKFTVGEWTGILNQESIDYNDTASKLDTDGYCVEFSTNGFTLDAFLVSGWSTANFGWWRPGNTNGWFVKVGDADATIGQMYFKAAYGADFGTVSGMYWYAGKDNSIFGVAYSGAAGSVSYFVNVLGYYTTEFAKVQFEPFVSYSAGSLGLKMFNQVTYDLTKDNDALAVMTVFKATYGIGSVTPYLYVNDGNWLADDFKCEIKPGVTGNVGEMSYDIAIDITAQKDINIDVPVTFTIAF